MNSSDLKQIDELLGKRLRQELKDYPTKEDLEEKLDKKFSEFRQQLNIDIAEEFVRQAGNLLSATTSKEEGEELDKRVDRLERKVII